MEAIGTGFDRKAFAPCNEVGEISESGDYDLSWQVVIQASKNTIAEVVSSRPGHSECGQNYEATNIDRMPRGTIAVFVS